MTVDADIGDIASKGRLLGVDDVDDVINFCVDFELVLNLYGFLFGGDVGISLVQG